MSRSERSPEAPSFRDVLVRGIKQAELKPRSPRDKNRALNAAWNRKQHYLPNYSAKELAADYRTPFTRKDSVTAMEVELARHMHYELERGFRKVPVFGWQPTKVNRAVLSRREFLDDLKEKCRVDDLSFRETQKVLHGARVTLNEYEAGGAKRQGDKLTLTYEQSRRLYTFDGSPKELSWRSIAILDRAYSQSQGQARVGDFLFYDPRLDPKSDELKEELVMLQRASMVQRSDLGIYAIHEARFRYWHKEFDWSQGLLGSGRWAERAAERFENIGREIHTPKLWRDGHLFVSMRRETAKNRPSLQHGLADSTQERYKRVANRLEKLPIEQLPQHLAERANSVARSTWWVDHAVARRMTLYYQQQAFKQGNDALGSELARLRRGLEAMDYQSLRTTPKTISPQGHRTPVSEEAYQALIGKAERVGDNELRDALIVSKHTGLRPEELDRGVLLRPNTAGHTVIVDVSTAKRRRDVDSDQPKVETRRSFDRHILAHDKELHELANRHQGAFRPESSKNDLRLRLTELRNDVPGAEHVSFYTFRHQFADDLRLQGHSPEYLQQQLGHRNAKSSDTYGSR